MLKSLVKLQRTMGLLDYLRTVLLIFTALVILLYIIIVPHVINENIVTKSANNINVSTNNQNSPNQATLNSWNQEGPYHYLDPHHIPNTVLYVWCGPPRWFKFRHYVSVMSVIKNTRPDNIIFYYQNLPTVDNMFYNTWFDELKEYFPFFSVIPLGKEEKKACNSEGKPRSDFVIQLTSKIGGIYIGENTILSSRPVWLLTTDITHGLEENPQNGIYVSQRNMTLPSDMDTIPQLYKSISCEDISYTSEPFNRPVCVTLRHNINPENMWTWDDTFGSLVRWIVYGSPEIRQAKMSPANAAPYVAHMIWIRGRRMDYLFYLCVLSAIYVAKFDKVYIHGDLPPTGEYWEKIKDNENIILIHRNSFGTSIYGNYVKRIPHWSDAVRVEIMIKYGGVYIDTDLLIVQPLDHQLLNYDVVATYDFLDRHPFPNSFSCGFMIGKKHATFWYLFQESMKWFMDRNWEWNGLLQPYKVMERHPGLVYMDRHLQVICLHGLCHPTWWSDHKNMTYHHLNSGLPLNWRTDTNIFHLCGKYPLAYHNESSLMKSQDMFGEIGRFVLQKAGLL